MANLGQQERITPQDAFDLSIADEGLAFARGQARSGHGTTLHRSALRAKGCLSASSVDCVRCLRRLCFCNTFWPISHQIPSQRCHCHTKLVTSLFWFSSPCLASLSASRRSNLFGSTCRLHGESLT